MKNPNDMYQTLALAVLVLMLGQVSAGTGTPAG